ncbi:hypothetical protein Trydic_g8572 [Trypoxylus dichotomus]
MNFPSCFKISRINLIDILTRFFGLTPLTLSETTWCRILGKFYGTVYSFGLMYIFYYQIKLRIVFGFPKRSNKVNFVSALSTSILFGTNILISLTTAVFKVNKYAYMMERLSDLQRITSKYSGGNNNKKYLVLMIFLVHIWYGTVTAGDLALGISGWMAVEFYIYDSHLRYRLLVFTVYLYFLLKEVHDDLRFFNNLLKEYSDKGKMVVPYGCGGDIRKITHEICNAFVQFNEIVLNFNDIFGWILLLLLLQYFYIYLVLSNSITGLIAGYKVHWAYPTNVGVLLVYATVWYINKLIV